MAQFLVITTTDVPALGTYGSARVYRGDHATEQQAVDAAALAMNVGDGTRLWAMTASSATRYLATVTQSFSTATG